MGKRFTVSERRAFVREWKRSGVSAKAFCAGRGIHPWTLYSWARGQSSSAEQDAGLRLVEVVPTTVEESDPATRWAWELTGTGGSVRGVSLDAALLRVLVEGVTRGRG
jgi:hypothetical protein